MESKYSLISSYAMALFFCFSLFNEASLYRNNWSLSELFIAHFIASKSWNNRLNLSFVIRCFSIERIVCTPFVFIDFERRCFLSLSFLLYASKTSSGIAFFDGVDCLKDLEDFDDAMLDPESLRFRVWECLKFAIDVRCDDG